MDEKSVMKKRLIESVPLSLKDPSVWVPLVVGVYVLILGLCLTGALKRQETSIRELRREQKKAFTQNARESDDDDGVPATSVNPRNKNERKRTGRKRVDLGGWNDIGCR